MSALMMLLRQPSTIAGMAAAAAFIAYWATGSEAITVAVFAVLQVAMPDHTVELARAQGQIGTIRAVADALRPAAKVMLPLAVAGTMLGACTPGNGLPPVPRSPAIALYEVEAGFDVVLKQAHVYAGLPRCDSGVAAPCANPRTVQALYVLAEQTNAGLMAARVALATATAAPHDATATARADAAVHAAADALTSFAHGIPAAKPPGGTP